MQQGSIEQALQLAKTRWAILHSFDLDVATWESLFAEHRATDVLEAIRKTKRTTATEPADIYRSLIFCLTRLEQDRAERANPQWPPFDVQRN